MIPGHSPDDWPFQTLKLGDRSVTERERLMLIQKAQSIVFLGLETE